MVCRITILLFFSISSLHAQLDIRFMRFYKNDKEIGRYVEVAQETLEKDILAILNESGYKHSYEE